MKEIILPWPEWKIEKILGRGSFGEVYQVVREEFGRKLYAAVKVIRIPADENEVNQLEDSGISAKSYLKGMIEDLTNEIIVMHTLKGAPNIVSIEDYKIIEAAEKIQWTIYIRMELLQDLNEYKRNHSMTFEQIVRVGCDICNALEICREKKIVHRDIKPSNIFVSSFGEFKLGDFGISKHTEHTQLGFSTRVGTGSYMAPEIYKGTKYDYSVDLYSLGIVIFQLANDGRLPFYPPYGQDVLPGDEMRILEKRIKGEPFPDPVNGGKALGDIIRKACQIDPKQRYQSPKEMQEELKKLITGEAAMRNSKREDLLDREEQQKTIKLEDIEEPVIKEKSSRKNHYKVIVASIIGLLGVAVLGTFVVGQIKKSGKQNQTEQATEIETETETQTKVETETETLTEAETETETQTEAKKETETETEAETESETQIELETKTQTETHSEVEIVQESVRNDKTVAIDPVYTGGSYNSDEMEPIGPEASEEKRKYTAGTVDEYGDFRAYEYDLDLSLRVQEELLQRGYNVVLTRKDNETPVGNKERAVFATENGADITVSICVGYNDEESQGAFALIPSPDNKYIGYLYEECYRLGECLLDGYCLATGMKNNGFEYRDDKASMNWSTNPVIYFKVGHVSSDDKEKILDDSFKEVMAKGIADGIDLYFESDSSQ